MPKKLKHIEQFQDRLARLYPDSGEAIKDKEQRNLTRNVTFMVTNDCSLRCKYCYEINKGHDYMTFETAKKFIDLLLSGEKGFSDYVDPSFSKGIILEFIGGEPFLAIDLIDQIVEYFKIRSIELQHPWATNYMISICSNGVAYFDPKVQDFLRRNQRRMSFSVTIDGDKELHDSCRVFPDGVTGSYDLAVAAAKDWMDRGFYMGSKITIAPGNLQHLKKAILHMVDLGYDEINANCVYEKGWEQEHAIEFYKQLKDIADYWNDYNIVESHFLSLFEKDFFKPKKEDDLQTWCWGAGTPILTDKGYKPIEEIKIGDIVYTKDGTFHAVTNTMNHFADNCVKISTCGSIPFVCTDNHQLYAKPFDYRGWRNVKHYKDYDKYPVSELSDTKDLIEYFVLPSDRVIDVDKNVAYLFGRTIGDGWYNDTPYCCCGKDELEELIKCFNDAQINYHITEAKTTYDFGAFKTLNQNNNNYELYTRLCSNMGRGCENKRIPEECFLWNNESLEALIKGYLSADGNYRKNLARFNTVSFELYNDLLLILRTLGYKPMGCYCEKRGDSYIQGRLVHCHDRYHAEFDLRKKAKYYMDYEDKHYVSHFKKESAEPQMVYNITVEGVHNYIAGTWCSSNCGGTGQMLAVDWRGYLYPCIRYVDTSLGCERPPIIIGDVDNGLAQRECEKNCIECMRKINRRTKMTDECFYCPIAEGCSECAAYNYQVNGTMDSHVTFICEMHKARALANVYFWNTYYRKIGSPDRMECHVPKDWALNIISEEEYNMLIDLSKP